MSFPICGRCFHPVPPGGVRRIEAAPTPGRPDRMVVRHLHTPCAAESDRIAEMGRRFEELFPYPKLTPAAAAEGEG